MPECSPAAERLGAREVRGHFAQYIREARLHDTAGRLDAAWANLEAAHTIGQCDTALHVCAHVDMARLAWRHRDVPEWLGQCGRIVATALITWLWVPRGNPGRASVSPFRSMEIPDDLLSLAGLPERVDPRKCR